MSLKQKLIHGMMTEFLGFFVKMGAMLLLMPLMVSLLGVDAYGTYLVFLSLSELSLMVAYGLTTGMVKELGQSLGAQDTPRTLALLASARWFYGLLALTILSLGWLLLPAVLAFLFKAPSVPQQTLVNTGRLVLVYVAVSVVQQYLLAILSAYCQQSRKSGLESVQGVLDALSAVGVLMAGFGLPGVFAARLLLAAGALAMALRWASRVEPLAFTGWAQWRLHPAVLAELTQISLLSVLQRIAVFVAHRMDELVIAAMLTVADVTCFGMVMRMVGQVAALAIRVSDGLAPLFSRFDGETRLQAQAQNQSRRLYLRSTATVHVVTSMLLILVMGGFPEFLHALSQGQVALAQAMPIAWIVAATVWSGSVQIPANNYLFSSGRHRFQTVSSVLTSLANLGCSLVFIRWFGLPGVILGTLVPHGIQHQLVSIPMTVRALNIPWTTFLSECYLKTLPPLLVAGVGVLGLRLAFAAETLIPLPLLLTALAALGLAAGVCWILTGLSPEERALGLGWLNTRAQARPVAAEPRLSLRHRPWGAQEYIAGAYYDQRSV